MATDPISLVYNGIWEMLEASADFTTAVKEGNRIKYTEDTRAPEKSSGQAADFPQVTLLSLGVKPHPENTSSSSHLIVLWSLEVAVGDRLLDPLMNLDWIIFGALHEWRTYLRDRIRFNGKPCVTLFRPKDVDDEIVARRKLRVPEGWTSVWVGECHMYVARTDMYA